MAEINNPKAFPSKKFDKRESQRLGGTCYSDHEEGMSLRDYFAAKAMQAVMTGEGYRMYSQPKDVAQLSYLMADAMLKQRQE